MRPNWLSSKSTRKAARRPSRFSTRLRRSLFGGLAALLSVVGLVAFATPAFAHNNVVRAKGACATPLGTGEVVTWTISNDYNLAETATVTSVTDDATPLPLSTLSSTTVSIAATPNGSAPVYQWSNAVIVQTLPAGTAQGTLTLNISGKWSDGYTLADAGTFSLDTLSCSAPTQTIAGHIYLCQDGNPTDTEETGGTLGASGPQIVPTQPNPMYPPIDVDAGSYTMNATPPSGYQLVACGGTSVPSGDGSTATDAVTVPVGGAGVGIFYVQPVAVVTQYLSGIIYLCDGGVPTTTVATGGTIAATGGTPTSTIPATANPLAATSVNAGDYTMTATPPADYTMVACQGQSVPNGDGSSATLGLTVPPAGNANGIFYVQQDVTPPIKQTLAANIYLCTNGNTQTTTPVNGGGISAAGGTPPQHKNNFVDFMPPTPVHAGAWVVTADTAPGYILVTCGGSSVPSSDGTTATNSTTVPAGGASVVNFYVELLAPGISVVKTASTSTYTGSGQTITYSFLVTNTGNETLSDITINDALPGLGAITCPDSTLVAAASETCTASYTTTSGDLTAGSVTNTATAQGNPPGSTTPVVSPPSSVTVNYVAPPVTSPSTVTPTTAAPAPATAPKTAASTTAATSSTALAFTGAALSQEWLLGLGAVILGAGLVLATRLRRRLPRPRHAAKK